MEKIGMTPEEAIPAANKTIEETLGKYRELGGENVGRYKIDSEDAADRAMTMASAENIAFNNERDKNEWSKIVTRESVDKQNNQTSATLMGIEAAENLEGSESDKESTRVWAEYYNEVLDDAARRNTEKNKTQ